MASIVIMGTSRIDRQLMGKSTVQCDLSETPDAAWRAIIEQYDQEIPVLFFTRVAVNGSVLTATFPHSEQSEASLRTALEKRVESANIRSGRQR